MAKLLLLLLPVVSSAVLLTGGITPMHCRPWLRASACPAIAAGGARAPSAAVQLCCAALLVLEACLCICSAWGQLPQGDSCLVIVTTDCWSSGGPSALSGCGTVSSISLVTAIAAASIESEAAADAATATASEAGAGAAAASASCTVSAADAAVTSDAEAPAAAACHMLLPDESSAGADSASRLWLYEHANGLDFLAPGLKDVPTALPLILLLAPVCVLMADPLLLLLQDSSCSAAAFDVGTAGDMNLPSDCGDMLCRLMASLVGCGVGGTGTGEADDSLTVSGPAAAVAAGAEQPVAGMGGPLGVRGPSAEHWEGSVSNLQLLLLTLLNTLLE